MNLHKHQLYPALVSDLQQGTSQLSFPFHGVSVCKNTLGRVQLCLFSPYLMVLIIDNQRGIHFYQIRQLPCSTRGARAHNLVVHLPFRMDSFVHGHVFFFIPLIDRFV